MNFQKKKHIHKTIESDYRKHSDTHALIKFDKVFFVFFFCYTIHYFFPASFCIIFLSLRAPSLSLSTKKNGFIINKKKRKCISSIYVDWINFLKKFAFSKKKKKAFKLFFFLYFYFWSWRTGEKKTIFFLFSTHTHKVDILRGACREFSISDENLVIPSIQKLVKVVDGVPLMEQVSFF